MLHKTIVIYDTKDIPRYTICFRGITNFANRQKVDCVATATVSPRPKMVEGDRKPTVDPSCKHYSARITFNSICLDGFVKAFSTGGRVRHAGVSGSDPVGINDGQDNDLRKDRKL